jgi:hypothetical protein
MIKMETVRALGGTDALPKLHGRKRGNEALLRRVRRSSAGFLPDLWLRKRDRGEVLWWLRQADRGNGRSRARNSTAVSSRG